MLEAAYQGNAKCDSRKPGLMASPDTPPVFLQTPAGSSVQEKGGGGNKCDECHLTVQRGSAAIPSYG
jgi:hypothetical protein